jgi:hypothetical protein
MHANKFKQSNAFRKGCSMPSGLNHKPGSAFDPNASEVYRWLSQQPELLSYLFGKMQHSGAIVFDPESGTWSGRYNRKISS